MTPDNKYEISKKEIKLLSELEFVKAEQEKLNAPIRKQLRRIERVGDLDSVEGVRRISLSKQLQLETLLVNNFVTFGGPSANIPFNHYKLTETGENFLYARA